MCLNLKKVWLKLGKWYIKVHVLYYIDQVKYFFSSKISGFKLNIMLNLPVLSNTYSIISDSFSLKMFDVFLQRANC